MSNAQPVAYWNGKGSIIPAEDVSYLPNWSDYYPIPLYTAPTIPAKMVINSYRQKPVSQLFADGWNACRDEMLSNPKGEPDAK